MSFRWVESFGENESYIKCLVPDATYNSLSEMITDLKTNGIIVDNVGDKEKTDLSRKYLCSNRLLWRRGKLLQSDL